MRGVKNQTSFSLLAIPSAHQMHLIGQLKLWGRYCHRRQQTQNNLVGEASYKQFNEKVHSGIGFTLVELLITLSILGILSSIALVNISSSLTRSRLLSTTRELENWLGEQRSYAMTNNITCLVTIDVINKRLISSRDSDDQSTSCSGRQSTSNADTFDLPEKFGDGGNNISLSFGTDEDDQTLKAIRFQHQGFIEHHQISSEGTLEDQTNSDGILELRLAYKDLQHQRCIRIISPIGIMRDGILKDRSSSCVYDKTY